MHIVSYNELGIKKVSFFRILVEKDKLDTPVKPEYDRIRSGV